uniref:Ig-like domain-containing protein n=1 Tax=Amphilophus citrinellus TaxID=61819 RepID=A0A3Q0R4M8_AMPCI
MFKHKQRSGSWEVVVDSGVESVQLPCKAVLNMLKDIKVEWKDRDNRMVHVYQSSSDRPEEQDDFYRGRTKMERNLLKPGDLSLTLKLPTDEDTNIYTCTCTVSSREGKILTKKEVQLLVRGQVSLTFHIRHISDLFVTNFILCE